MVTQHGVHRSGFVCLIHENAPTEAKFRATESYFFDIRRSRIASAAKPVHPPYTGIVSWQG